MSQSRLAVLNVSHDDADTRRNFRRELDADLVEFDASGGELPDTFDFDGGVVTGSRSSVYWDDPWIDPLEDWIGEAIQRGLPFLGVCYGHQLLADVLGGTVRDMGTYEIGYHEIDHTGDSRLFSGVDERFTAFTTHSDAVTELPPGARALAENEYSNQGFRKDRVFGVQFHPEYDLETAEALTCRKDLIDERRRRVLSGVTQDNYDAAKEAKLVFENFTEYVDELRTSPAAAD